jgi:hypothetical protein
MHQFDPRPRVHVFTFRSELLVDADAGSFVEDLNAEDLHAGSCLVGSGEGDVERKDLIGEGGECFLFEAGDFIETLTAELVASDSERLLFGCCGCLF